MPPKNNLIVVDGNYLCYRAFHTTGMLRNADQPTGVMYGFFVAVRTLAAQLGSRYFAFCFDYGRGKREELYPDYKKARRDRANSQNPTEKLALQSLREQVNKLRDTLLTEVGFRNVYKQAGYEADDLIAKCVQDLPFDQFTIVSGDADLYQLLSKERDVTIWNPVNQKMMTETHFTNTYGVPPSKWAWVKACAGCSSDGIKGVKGVGEKGALAYLTRRLDPTTAKAKLIEDNRPAIGQNLRLTKLPMTGCNDVVWTDDELDHAKWEKVASTLGFRSIPRLFDTPGFGVSGVKRGS